MWWVAQKVAESYNVVWSTVRQWAVRKERGNARDPSSSGVATISRSVLNVGVVVL